LFWTEKKVRGIREVLLKQRWEWKEEQQDVSKSVLAQGERERKRRGDQKLRPSGTSIRGGGIRTGTTGRRGVGGRP